MRCCRGKFGGVRCPKAGVPLIWSAQFTSDQFCRLTFMAEEASFRQPSGACFWNWADATLVDWVEIGWGNAHLLV
jgi:hypothetical protein